MIFNSLPQKHLKNENKKLSWFKYLMLDVLLTVLFGFASVLFIFAYIVSKTKTMTMTYAIIQISPFAG